MANVLRCLLAAAPFVVLLACDGGTAEGGSGGGGGGVGGGGGGVFLGGGQAPIAVDCVHHGSGTDFQVGNPEVDTGDGVVQVATIGEVPWESLAPGDTVRIFHRATPYAEKMAIATSGTEDQPIRVCGVPGSAGELPVILGDGATTRAELGDVFEEYGQDSMQQRALLVIRAPVYEERVEHVQVEGLRFTGTILAPYHAGDVTSFVDWDGATRAYDDAGAGIRIQKAAHVVLRGNEFDHLAVGVYVISQDFDEQFMVRDFLLEGNYFHENALVDDYDMHQAYIQGCGFTVQYNYFGSPTAGSLGNDLKMRTAGEVIRHNYFENGAHALDLVDVEDHVGRVMPWAFARTLEDIPEEDQAAATDLQEADWAAYQATFVYGNLFRMAGADAWPSVVHYGFDNSPFDRRPGTLFFYHNTLLYETDFEDDDTMRIFDCCSDFADSYYGDEAQQVGGDWHYVVGGTDYGPMLQQVPEDFPLMRATNNVFVLTSHTPGATRSDWEWNRWSADRVALDANFITSGWDAQDEDQSAATIGFGGRLIDPSVVYPGGNEGHHVVGVENLVTAETSPIDPETFEPLAGSPLADAADPLPGEIPAALHPMYEIRLVAGSPGRLHIAERATRSTLGAIEATP